MSSQVQGYLENFKSSCPQDDTKWLNTKYSAFTEGWGLYAEYPLVAEMTDAYENKPLSRYGMLKGQVRGNVGKNTSNFLFQCLNCVKDEFW
jgi:hypothetical protein